ncbi:DUF2723 domain-containing protein [Flaviaesturariibacter amylovorans]|uniref:DUF2723 domain-containing protein n=1 Tax=Flaviaesturariibacter amylovorans TaxID=1084520 RepID=A0ABP8GP68_9BACT
MNFKRVNDLTGWVVCIIACLVYVLTAEKSGSFWDCGEFVAAAYKLQLPHPPGAPVFTILGRFFIVLFGGSPDSAAKAVNIMNALASGFTILFLFWTITHFARKLVSGLAIEPTRAQTATIMGAGIVGGLAYTFTDSFWYSAVEGEVYALSSFFTALIFWAMLKWERADVAAGTDRQLRNYADRWIVFIAFMTGLAIGVHLLGLLTIPALVMIYYYRRYEYTRKGAIYAFLIGCAITGVVQVAVIQWTVKFAGKFDIFFVNNFNLPFFSGFIFFFVLLAAGIWWGLRAARKNGWSFLRLALWSVTFMMLGYSLYATTLLRSAANPSIDMNNVDNPMSLNYYLGREQYGSAPLVKGPYFTTPVLRDESGQAVYKEGDMRYSKSNGRYVALGRSQDVEYESEVLFPRLWDRSNDQGHADFYVDWLNLSRSQDAQSGQTVYEQPTYGDNIRWFVTYQMGHMYWRYFMWNFAGRQNDIQGFGNKRDGNWISGISVIDNMRLGDQKMLPESIRNNKASNKLLLLPLLLGVFGCVYHFLKDRRDWVVSFLLFFFTGLAIVLYLNQPGNQPRERDYAFAGSFYAFAIWIGLSVVGFVRLAHEHSDRKTLFNALTYGALTTLIITLMANTTTTAGGAMGSAVLAGLIYAAVIGLIYFIVKAVAGKSEVLKTSSVALATLLCLSAPVLMAAQEWDDHDRSNKTLAPDLARTYLEGCAKNAILFTFGDNDTYPLWYAQEVEGVRPDIRIINTSLLGIDWYVNQLRYKVNESAPIDVIWDANQITGFNVLFYQPQGDQTGFQPLYPLMKDQVGRQLMNDDKTQVQPVIPTKRLFIPVDVDAVRRNGTVQPGDSVISGMPLEIQLVQDRYIGLDRVAILNIIAANAQKGWERPIYFTSPMGDLGFYQYLRKDGMALRLVPVEGKFPQQNWVTFMETRKNRMGGVSIHDNNDAAIFQNAMKFRAGGANLPRNYFDEENRRHLLDIRGLMTEIAGNYADKGKKAEAVQMLRQIDQIIAERNLPVAMASRYASHNVNALQFLEAAYKAGDLQRATRLRSLIEKDLQEQKRYYDYLREERPDLYQSEGQDEYQNNVLLEKVLPAIVRQYDPAARQAAPENVTPQQAPPATQQAPATAPAGGQ